MILRLIMRHVRRTYQDSDLGQYSPYVAVVQPDLRRRGFHNQERDWDFDLTMHAHMRQYPRNQTVMSTLHHGTPTMTHDRTSCPIVDARAHEGCELYTSTQVGFGMLKG